MKNYKLDFFPEVIQAIAGDNFTVYAYMNDGSVRLYDAKAMIESGGVFDVLKDPKVFAEKLTVMNHTIAWDINGDRDVYHCLDIDPFTVYECPIVDDILEKNSYE